MNKINKIKFFFLFFISTLMCSCASRIDFVLKNPGKYHNKVISVKGTVISSLSLEDISIYSIKDKSGKMISVIAEDRLPIYQQKVRTKGLVDTCFVYHQKNKMIVVNEKTFKEKKNTPNHVTKTKEAVVFDF